MDARVTDRSDLPNCGIAEKALRAGRTLAENREHLAPRNWIDGTFSRDVAGTTRHGAVDYAYGGAGDAFETALDRKFDWRAKETRLPRGLRLAKGLAAVRACKRHAAMRTFQLVRSCVLGVGMVAAGANCALAFDDKVFDEAGGVKAESNPWAVFQFGYSAYKSGHKDQAAEAYRYAAENGQIGATWKLARMYAAGDGVTRDDYEAFKFFSEIVEQDVEPGSRDESYVSDALVALAGYLKTGIPGSPVEANPVVAQEYYMRAAAN